MTPKATSPAELDRAVTELAEAKAAWARRPLGERLELLRLCLGRWVSVADDAARAGCVAKGLLPDSPAASEEWLSCPVPVIRNIRLLMESLREIDTHGRPRARVERLSDGSLAVRALPRAWHERLFFPGMRIDVRLEPGVDELGLAETQASAYRGDAPREGAVALVLGAGNVGSIGPMDVLHKLFVENHVAILKMHPVNAYLGPFIERAFAPLIEARALRVVYGDAAEGQHLLAHPGLDEMHMTGSAAVHDRIVWGETPAEQAERRAARRPRFARRITSELGCVTPVIVAPGEWSEKELDYHAEHVATMVAINASCNCNAAKVLVTWRDWPQRAAFLRKLAGVLASLPSRRAYYPGSFAKFDRFRAVYPGARELGARGTDTLPFTTIFDIDPAGPPLAFEEEAWCPIVAETALPADDAAGFLMEAARFCNTAVAGTLSAVLLVDAQTQARLRSQVDDTVTALRYGTVAVNYWSAAGYALAVAPWGAYPGHTLENVGSGIGVVHNTLMLERVVKAVLWAPFVLRPKPPWFVTHPRAHRVARRMVAFEARPSAWRTAAVALTALGAPWP